MPDSQASSDIPMSMFSVEAARHALDTPWKATNEIRRLLIMPLVWWTLRGVDVAQGWRCYGLPVIQRHRRSMIQIGARMSLRSTVASNPLGPMHPVIISTRRAGSRLSIGDDFGMTGGSLVVDQSITIGHRVWVGANTIITDTDFHPLDPYLRQVNPLQAKTVPVSIADDVFIGMNCLILKGVTVGARSVIGAGSVVTRDVPEDAIVAGNPAQVIRYIKSV